MIDVDIWYTFSDRTPVHTGLGSTYVWIRVDSFHKNNQITITNHA